MTTEPDIKTPVTVFSPEGREILGTLELIQGRGYCTFGVTESGEFEWEYDGETKVFWDGQITATNEDDEAIFLDDLGQEWPLSKLVFKPIAAES